MHDLEQLIAEWRKTMTTAPTVGSERLDELESHLRETVDQLVRLGMTGTEAFHRAVTALGPAAPLASEFQKLDRRIWLPVKLITGLGVAVALALSIFLFAGLDDRPSKWLLAAHVFAVTLGYSTAFFIGTVGICFICQRCVSEFSPVRLQSLRRVSYTFGWVALCLTTVGVILGGIWTNVAWGRFWSWDEEEIHGVGAILWFLLFLAAHRGNRVKTHELMAMSVFGNVMVLLIWFGLGTSLLGDGLHSYGTPDYQWLLL